MGDDTQRVTCKNTDPECPMIMLLWIVDGQKFVMTGIMGYKRIYHHNAFFISAFDSVSNMLANANTPIKVEEAKVSGLKLVGLVCAIF